MGIGVISTYPPRRCGIASVAFHLRQALLAAGEDFVPVVALVKSPTDTLAGPEVVAQIHQHVKGDYRKAAAVLNALPLRAVILEHEFALFGGPLGAHVLELLGALRAPVITVFHTIMASAPPQMIDMVRRVAAASAAVVVLCERARELITTRFGVPPGKVVHIPNGAPLPPEGNSEEWKERLGLSGRTVALTFGLLSPSKGIETALAAVAQVAPDHPELLYVVAGATHPEEVRLRGEGYRARLEQQVAHLGIGGHVRFVARYLTEEEVVQYVHAADLYVTPYVVMEQTSSATLATAAFLGKALLSTPYDYAAELLAGGAGYLFPAGDSAALAQGLRRLLDSPEERARLGEAARARAAEFAWQALGHRYRQLADVLPTPRTVLQQEPPIPPGAGIRARPPLFRRGQPPGGR
ncbi:glycosyltransferase involved in cell wall biosynthesis [Symbiobacterium terraclitae]|uniref:Glycosyltransferase involved in cell wall biosynthesis n=1 Tax=Symbiobacterium terraclitae TaxID=557451 RepID=A0ABS4JVL8_9FIRM|nr:glycosyltransferase [Symbiobacterium terraclitae]MBP2019571.1 glycosyltransferase involved in cell wall biosynthesis [Symbiobacterium terraclitae]